MVELLTKNPDEFKKNMDAINVIGNMQQEYGVKVDINTNGDEKIAKVKSITDALKNDKTEITKDIITNYAKDPNNPNQSQFQGILDNWQTLVGSAKSITKTMAINFVTAGTDNDVLKAYMVATGITPLKGKGFADQKKRLMPKAQAWLTGIGGGSQGVGSGEGTGKITPTGGQRDTTLDETLRALRNTAAASINPEKGNAEISRITKGKGVTKFTGMDQQLLTGLGGDSKGGFNREFISMLGGMDNATLKTYVDMKKLKKGIVELLGPGKQLKEALNEKAIREYSVAQTEAAQNAIAQRAALLKLKAAGVDTATALEMVSDANLAVAINGKDISNAELKTMADEAKRAKDEVESLNLALQITAETSRKDLKQLQSDLDVLGQVKAKYPAMTTEQLGALAANPEMMAGFKKLLAGVGTSEELATLKTNLEDWAKNLDLSAKIKVDIDATINPIQSMKNKISETGSKMQSFFALSRAKVEQNFRPQMKPAQDRVEAAQIEVNSAQAAVDAAQKAADAETKIYEQKVKDIEDIYKKDDANNISRLEDRVKAESDAAEEISRNISKLQHEIQVETDRIENEFTNPLIQGTTGFMERNIEKIQRYIEINYTRAIEGQQAIIDQADRRIELNFTRPINALQESSDSYSNDLTLIDHATEAINKKYDAQEEALNKISAINNQIVSQQKEQLDLAGAIASGDIASAAKAMQHIQSSRVSDMAKTQQDAITAARSGEINALTGATSGLTKDQIEAKQWEISRQIYDLQQKQKVEEDLIAKAKDEIFNINEKIKSSETIIRVLEDQIYDKNILRQTALDNLATKQTALNALEAQAYANSITLQIAQDALKTKQDARDAALKAAQETHDKNMVKIDADLATANTNLTTANEKLLAAETALAAIQAKVDAELSKIAAMEQEWVDLETAIANAEIGVFDFKTEIGLAQTAVENLVKALGDQKAAADLAAKASADAAAAEVQGTKDKTAAKIAADAALAKAAADALAAAQYKAQHPDAANDANNLAQTPGAIAEQNRIAAEKAAQQKIIDDINNKEAITKADLDKLKAAQAEADRLAALEKQNAQFEAERIALQEAANKAIADKAAADKAVADKAAADAASGHKGTKAQGLAIYPWIQTLGSAGDSILRGYGYWANGGLIPRGTDTVPAMLTPGEFVMSRYAVNTQGTDKMKAINNGDSVGDAVYNYSVNVNVKSDANPDEIARAVMMQIKQVDGQKIRGNRY